MARPRNSPARTCSALGVFVLLGGVIALGLAANGLSPLQSLIALGFGAGVLLLAAMWEWTLRRAATAAPLSAGQRAWNVVVFVVWALAITALVWWYLQGHE